jgi:cytochrome c peroxidase
MIPAALAAVLLASVRASALPPDPKTPQEALARVYDSAPFRRPAPKPSPELLALGRDLFFDPRLSRDGTLSCARCHDPRIGWSDGRKRGSGMDGQTLPRAVPSLLNVSRTTAFFWDGRAGSFTEAALAAVSNPQEMDTPLPQALARLRAIDGYPALFRAAFGDARVDGPRVGTALQAFVVAATDLPPSPFDRFAAGDEDAMSASARRGLMLFTGKARCQRCHVGPAFSDMFFHNTGVKLTPGYDDKGRYAVAPFRRDLRAFKTVPLRNAALTAPYMHNGSLATLEDVVEFYNRGGDVHDELDMEIKPLHLTAREKGDLVSFLRALTNPQVPVPVPVLPGETAPVALPLLDLPEARVAAAEKTLDGADAVASAAACPKDFTIPKAVASYDAGTAPSAVAYGTDRGQGELEDILFNRIYRVALTGDMSLCEPFKTRLVYAGISRPGSFWCRDLYLDAAAAYLLANRDPKFQPVCRLWVTVSYPAVAPAEAGEFCRLVERDVARPEALCDELSPRWIPAENKPACVAEFGRYTRFDDPHVCDYMKGATDSLHLRCDDFARLARVAAHKDPKLCGDSEVCRLLSGTGDTLPLKYEDRARKAWCAAEVSDALKKDAAAETRAGSQLDAAEEDLASAEAGRDPDDRALAARIDALGERLARARARLDRDLARRSAATQLAGKD